MKPMTMQDILENGHSLLINPLTGTVSPQRLKEVLQSLLMEAERQMPSHEPIDFLEGADSEDCREYNSIVDECKQVLRNMRGV